jgi:hypothetical protein
MTKEKANAPTSPLLKVAAGFLAAGLFLFLHVLLPVQAERSALELKQTEALLSRKKAELNELKTKYASMTSLPVLDQWAKMHGPWVPPSATNVIPIEK